MIKKKNATIAAEQIWDALIDDHSILNATIAIAIDLPVANAFNLLVTQIAIYVEIYKSALTK